MSELSERARAKAKEKVERLTRATNGKIDASGWKEPLGENGQVQTGPRVLSRRAFRVGGKVAGAKAFARADRKPRAKGGGIVDDLVNVDMKKANELRDGVKQDGGMKKGGRAKKFGGGPMMSGRPMPVRPEMRPEMRPMMRAKGGKAETHDASCACAKCHGGRTGKAAGGEIVADGKLEGTRPVGGRMARKGGGRAKKGMNVNIIIAPPQQAKPAMPMPPPGMPPGGPPGLHQAPPPAVAAPGAQSPQGAMPPPQMRKSGGRAYPLTGASGGGLGRLEKIRAYG